MQEGVREDQYYSILNIFYYVKAKYIRISFTYGNYRYQGIVEEVEQDYIRIIIPDFQETSERKGLLSFEALNRYYLAQVQVVRSNENGIFFAVPEEIRYLARRRHIRLNFDDLFMRFIILYSPILRDRAAEKNMEARYPHFMTEVLHDEPSLKIVYQMFLSEVQKVSRDLDVVMLYDRPVEELTLAEKLLLETGKSIYIEDVSKIGSYINKIDSHAITNLQPFYESLHKELGEYKALLQIEELKKQDSRAFLVSYLMVPFTILGRVIGYVRLETNQFDKHFITLAQAEELAVVSELFSYAITKIRIRRSHFDVSSVQTRVVNISLSGLLMEFTDVTLYYYLQKHRRIKMLIPIEGMELEIYGEIVRYYEKNQMYYMGVLFFKSKPGDLYLLEKYIYDNLHYQFF